MDVPFLCVFLAFIFTYLFKIPAAIAQSKLPEGYDNSLPREQLARLKGWGSRAFAAHTNSFEVFPPFATAVIFAHLVPTNQKMVAILCVTFLISRLVYLYLYLKNIPNLRTLVWFIGMLCIITIFAMALF